MHRQVGSQPKLREDSGEWITESDQGRGCGCFFRLLKQNRDRTIQGRGVGHVYRIQHGEAERDMNLMLRRSHYGDVRKGLTAPITPIQPHIFRLL